jgi:hypothetical protein
MGNMNCVNEFFDDEEDWEDEDDMLCQAQNCPYPVMKVQEGIILKTWEPHPSLLCNYCLMEVQRTGKVSVMSAKGNITTA